jgi:hypothetical protein
MRKDAIEPGTGLVKNVVITLRHLMVISAKASAQPNAAKDTTAEYISVPGVL